MKNRNILFANTFLFWSVSFLTYRTKIRISTEEKKTHIHFENALVGVPRWKSGWYGGVQHRSASDVQGEGRALSHEYREGN
jgi:hypothetical protein